MDAAAGADARAALRDAAEVGAFFAVDTEATGSGWLPFRDLLEDETHRRACTAAARAMLADRAGLASDAIDERATASIQHLGTVARLVSPLLAVAARLGAAPHLSTATLRWRPLPGGPIEFAMLPDGFASLDTALPELIDPLGAAFATTWRLSPQIVRGNVASAIAGAAAMFGQARPQLRDDGERAARNLLDHPSLAGAGTWPTAARFRRHNCCLFYRIPGAGICGDCVLQPRVTPR